MPYVSEKKRWNWEETKNPERLERGRIAGLRKDYEKLTPGERIEQCAQLSRFLSGFTGQAQDG